MVKKIVVVLLEALLSIFKLAIVLVQKSFNQFVRLAHLRGLLPSWSSEKNVDSFFFLGARGERCMSPVCYDNLFAAGGVSAGCGHLCSLTIRVDCKRILRL